MSATHQELASLAAAYVVGALDGEDQLVFASHLAECAACAAEVRDLDRVADAMARGVPRLMPRPEIRDRVLDAIARLNSQPPTPNPQGGTVGSRDPWKLRVAGWRLGVEAGQLGVGSWRLGVGAWLPSAALVVVAIGLALNSMTLRSRADLEAVESDLVRGVLVAPDLARIDLAGQPMAPDASARALWSRRRGMVFAAQNLPALPAGRTYQVWVVTADGPVSAGLLAPDDSGRSIAVFITPADIGPPVAVAVTIEPEGGVAAPTGDRYLIGGS